MSPASWYTLGATSLRLKLWQKARNAFVRYLRFKADDGEGYGNLAVAFTMLKKKHEAYTVLGQGVSHAWNNWKLWQNYLFASVDTGHFWTATRAINRLIDMDQMQSATDLQVLKILNRTIEEHIPDEGKASSVRIQAAILDIFNQLTAASEFKKQTKAPLARTKVAGLWNTKADFHRIMLEGGYAEALSTDMLRETQPTKQKVKNAKQALTSGGVSLTLSDRVLVA